MAYVAEALPDPRWRPGSADATSGLIPDFFGALMPRL
jgi:hypothetical protein